MTIVTPNRLERARPRDVLRLGRWARRHGWTLRCSARTPLPGGPHRPPGAGRGRE